MSDQGEQQGPPTGEHPDWWARLYDAEATDTGRTRARDTLDDRFHSVFDAVNPAPEPAVAAGEAAPQREPQAAPPAPEPEPAPASGPTSGPASGPTDAPTPGRVAPTARGERRASLDEPALLDGPEPAPGPRPRPRPTAVPEPRADGGVGPGPGRGPESEPRADAERGPESARGPESESAPVSPLAPRLPPRNAPPPAPEPVSVAESSPGAVPSPGPEFVSGDEDVSSSGVEAVSVSEPGPVSEPEPETEPASGAEAEVEPGVLPVADPGALGELVPDTALDGARYGACTLRAVSVRGEAARRAGMLRGDALLMARFGAGESALLLVAVAAGSRTGPGAHRAAREACQSIGGAVGRSHARLAEDIVAGRGEALKSGLHRLTDRTLGKLRSQAAALGLDPEQHTADLRCLLLPADPQCRTRVFFGTGGGGLFRLRDGVWEDIEPRVCPVVGYGGEPEPRPTATPVPTMDPMAKAAAERDGFTEGARAEPVRSRPFRFRASVAQPGDALMVCAAGVAEPMREGTGFAEALAERWAPSPGSPVQEPPGLAAYLTALQPPLKGHEADRTAATVWET